MWDNNTETNVPVDYSDYAGVKVVFKTSETYDVTLEVGYGDTDSSNSEATHTCSGDATEEQEVYVAFNSEYSNQVNQIYLQIGGYYEENSETGNWDDVTGETTITLISATLISKTDDESTEESSETLILNNYSEVNWENNSGSFSYDTGENTATLTFIKSYGGLGWTFYSSTGRDLSDYDAIEVTYEDLSGTTIDLYVQDGATWSSGNTSSYSSSSGTITFAFADYSSLDYTNIANIVIQCGTLSGESATVTITSVKLIKYATSGGDEDVEYIITKETTSEDDDETTYNYYMNLGVSTEIWEMSDGDGGTLTGEGAGTITPNYSDDTEAYTGATLVFNGTDYGGMGWLYPNGVDMSTSYYQIVMTYTATATSGEDTPKILLDLYDANGNAAQANDNSETGKITLVFKNYNSKAEADEQVDFSQIVKIIVQASVPCTVTITNIELQTTSSGVVYDQYLLLSQVEMWGDKDEDGNVINTCEYNSETGNYDMTVYTSWTGGQWYFGDVDEDSYFGVYIKLQTYATCKIRLTVVYLDSDGTEHYENYSIDGSGTGADQWLFLPFDKEYDMDVEKIQIMCGDIGEGSAVVTLLSAELISPNDPDDENVNDQIRRIKTATNEGYGTYCCDKDFEMPEYLDGYIITAVAYEKSSTSEPDVKEDTDTGSEDNTDDGNNAKARVKKLAEGDEESVDEGDETDSDEYDFSEGYYITIKKAYAHDTEDGKYSSIVPAGVAILVKGCGDDPGSPLTYTAYVDGEGESNYVATDDDKAMADGNLLLGNSGQNTMSSSEMESKTVEAYSNEYAASDFYYFYLDYGKITPMTNYTEYEYLGFYWMNGAATEGGAFDMIANRAWLPLLKSHFTDSEGNPISLKIIEYVEEDSEEQTTGITTVPAETAESVSNGAVYTIQGVRVNNMNKPGVYIVDGKKVIKK